MKVSVDRNTLIICDEEGDHSCSFNLIIPNKRTAKKVIHKIGYSTTFYKSKGYDIPYDKIKNISVFASGGEGINPAGETAIYLKYNDDENCDLIFIGYYKVFFTESNKILKIVKTWFELNQMKSKKIFESKPTLLN